MNTSTLILAGAVALALHRSSACARPAPCSAHDVEAATIVADRRLAERRRTRLAGVLHGLLPALDR